MTTAMKGKKFLEELTNPSKCTGFCHR